MARRQQLQCECVGVLLCVTMYGSPASGQTYKAGIVCDVASLARQLDSNPNAANVRESDGNTGLHGTTFANCTSGVTLLLQRGANIDAQNDNGQTPLHLAVSRGHQDTVSLLLANGAKVNLTDKLGRSLLHYAASGSEKVAALLVAKGADVNARGHEGDTPLHTAALFCNTGMIEMLLSAGAAVVAADNQGNTPLHDVVLAKNRRFLTATSFRENRVASTRLLLDKGASPNAKDGQGTTPTIHAVGLGETELVVLLLAKSADITSRYWPSEMSLLHVAAANGRTDIARLLLDHGADPNQTNKDGQSPGDLAAANGHPEVQTLIAGYPMPKKRK